MMTPVQTFRLMQEIAVMKVATETAEAVLAILKEGKDQARLDACRVICESGLKDVAVIMSQLPPGEIRNEVIVTPCRKGVG